MKSDAKPLYMLRQAWLLVRGSPWLTTVSALTIALALTLVGLLAMVLFNANHLLRELGQNLTLSVYLKDSTSVEQESAVRKQLEGHAGIKKVKALSREEDRARNRRLLAPELLQGLDEAAIPGQPMLDVEIDAELASRGDVEALVQWTQALKHVDSVEDVEFGAEKLRLLFAMVEIARTIGLVLAVVLLASAMFFVFSTIRLAVFSRRDEIELLTLVGATPTFVRLPFLVEGGLQGLAGAVIAAGLLGLLHIELLSLVRDVYMLNVNWSLLPPGMVVWLIIGGPTVGLLASALSVGRYLKV
ncbi:MAG: ABC transporter permease [Myxococcales bacterium]|nr:ABC transporter permease [Myxococcales bacterium]